MSALDQPINIVFDGPPEMSAPRFIEVEDDNGKSVSVGTWVDRGDGTWALRLEPKRLELAVVALLCVHGAAICARCDLVPESWRLA